MNTYNKLLRIKYKNKTFDIFSSKNHRKVFLEVKLVDGKEKYFYVNFNDYVYLDKIYNHKSNILYGKKYNFVYKVILSTSLALSLTSAISILPNKLKLQKTNDFTKVTVEYNTGNIEETSANINLEDKLNNEVDISDIDNNNVIEYINISNISELDNYGIEKVTFDDVRKTLEQNDLIFDEYKPYVSEFIDLLEDRLPQVDLRTFNENLKKWHLLSPH